MKSVHCSMSSVRSIADNIILQVIPVHNPSPLLLSEQEIELSHKDMFEYVLIENVCPNDPCKKYAYLNILKNGLSVRSANSHTPMATVEEI